MQKCYPMKSTASSKAVFSVERHRTRSHKFLLVFLCYAVLGQVASSAPAPKFPGQAFILRRPQPPTKRWSPLPLPVPPSPPEEEATSELVYLGNRLLDDKGVNIDDQYGGFVADDNAYGMNMIRYLLAMQTRGYDVKEFVINQLFPSDVTSMAGAVTRRVGDDGEPILCKMHPFNICYKVDNKGEMMPVGDRRPVRLFRVYR